MARRRGGLYIRPSRLAIFAAPAPNAAGLVIPVVRHGRLLAAPTTETGMHL